MKTSHPWRKSETEVGAIGESGRFSFTSHPFFPERRDEPHHPTQLHVSPGRFVLWITPSDMEHLPS